MPANERATFELLAGGLDAEKLAENVVDRLPHDGDKLLMGDHSSCGEQSVDVSAPHSELEWFRQMSLVTSSMLQLPRLFLHLTPNFQPLALGYV